MRLKLMRMPSMAKISVCMMLGLQGLSVMAQGIQAQQLTLEASSTPITIQHAVNGLTQTQYQDLLNQYTQIVNDSKTVLDDPASSATAQQQKQAFCARYHAYKNIAEISKERIRRAGKKILVDNVGKEGIENLEINGDFDCSWNNLKNLKNLPKIKKSLFRRRNHLTSLEGCPEIINGVLDCSDNNLKSLEF